MCKIIENVTQTHFYASYLRKSYVSMHCRLPSRIPDMAIKEIEILLTKEFVESSVLIYVL